MDPSPASTSPADQTADTPEWQTVRLGLRWIFWWLACVAYCPMLWAWGSELGDRGDFPFWHSIAWIACATVAAGLGFWAVCSGRHLRYDLRAGRVAVGIPWRSGWTVYPRTDHGRLEYSIAHRTVYEVRPDGARHRLPIRAAAAHRADWQAFVESFHPEARTPITILPPRLRTRSWIDVASTHSPHSPHGAPAADRTSLIRVDCNRRRFRRMTAIAVPLYLAGFALYYVLGYSDNAWRLPVFAACSAFLVISVIPLFWKGYFDYDPNSGWIQSKSRRRGKIYPRHGFERLEYSVAHAQIHEVRANGRRRRVWMRPWEADPGDWKAFVQSFHPAAAEPVAIGSSADRD